MTEMLAVTATILPFVKAAIGGKISRRSRVKTLLIYNLDVTQK